MSSPVALCNLARPKEVSLTAYGSEGTLGLTDWARPVAARGEDPLEPLPYKHLPAIWLTDELAAAVRGGSRERLLGFEVGLEVQRVLEAWERSAATGQWVTVGYLIESRGRGALCPTASFT